MWLSEPERAALQGLPGTADPWQAILDQEVAAARGAILAGGGRVGPEGTLPDQLVPDVLAIVAWRYLLGYPALPGLQTAGRQAAATAARANLTAVARGEQKVELPPAGQAVPLSTPLGQVQVVRPGRHHPGRSNRLGRLD